MPHATKEFSACGTRRLFSLQGLTGLPSWRCSKRLDRRPLRPKALNMASPPSAMMMQNCWSMLELPRDEEGGTIDLADVQAAALQHAHNVEMQMGDPTVHRGALFAAGNDRTVDPPTVADACDL